MEFDKVSDELIQLRDSLEQLLKNKNKEKILQQQLDQQKKMEEEYKSVIGETQFQQKYNKIKELKEPDIQIKVNRVEDILDKGYYSVAYRNNGNDNESIAKKKQFRENAKRGNISIAVTGHLKKGKSFIQSKLSGQPLRIAQNLRTTGIQGMFQLYKKGENLEEDHQFLYLDTEGTMEPLQVYEPINQLFLRVQELQKQRNFKGFKDGIPRFEPNPELSKLKAKRAEKIQKVDQQKTEQLISAQVWEIFLQQFLLEKCNVIICVVGQMNQDEQIQINRIIEMQNSEKSKSRRKKIIVIHNWSNFVTWDQLVQQQQKDIEKCFHISKKERIGSIQVGDEQKDIFFFQEQRNELQEGETGLLQYDEQFKPIEHFCLMHELSEIGEKYNQVVIQRIRDIIDAQRDRNPWVLEEKFAEFCQENLQKYLKLRPFLKIDQDEQNKQQSNENPSNNDDRDSLKEGLEQYLLNIRKLERRRTTVQGKEVEKVYEIGTNKEYIKQQMASLGFTYVKKDENSLEEKIVSPIYSIKKYLGAQEREQSSFISLCQKIELHKHAQLIIPPDQVSVVPIVPKDIRLRYLVLPDLNPDGRQLKGSLKVLLEAPGVDPNDQDFRFATSLKKLNDNEDSQKENYDLTIKCRKQIPKINPFINKKISEKDLDKLNSQLIAEGEIIQTIQLELKQNVIPLVMGPSGVELKKSSMGIVEVARKVQ